MQSPVDCKIPTIPLSPQHIAMIILCESRVKFPDEQFGSPEMLEAFKTCQPQKIYHENTKDDYHIGHTFSKNPRYINTSLGTRLVATVRNIEELAKYNNCYTLSDHDAFGSQRFNLLTYRNNSNGAYDIFVCRGIHVPKTYDGTYFMRYV